MKAVEKPTYISLFSSAGIGCYGFKLEGFDCVATNELITRRLEVQKFNKKCKYESGYICGDITEDATKNALYDQIALWKKREGLEYLFFPVIRHLSFPFFFSSGSGSSRYSGSLTVNLVQ